MQDHIGVNSGGGSRDQVYAYVQDFDFDIDRDYTTRLISTAGGFTSNVRENILTHPVVVKNRLEPAAAGSHISTESRQVMRKGFDLGISSPGLRMLYDVCTLYNRNSVQPLSVDSMKLCTVYNLGLFE